MKAHQKKKSTFNVYLFKRLGSKALFFHFVRLGAKNISIPALLQQWREYKTTDEYKHLKRSSVEKTDYEKELKDKRDRLRRELKAKKKRKELLDH